MCTEWWFSLGSGFRSRHLCRGPCKGEDCKCLVLLKILCFEPEQHYAVTVLTEGSMKGGGKHWLHLPAT